MSDKTITLELDKDESMALLTLTRVTIEGMSESHKDEMPFAAICGIAERIQDKMEMPESLLQVADIMTKQIHEQNDDQ
jgi:hypothetical protein